MTRKKDTCEDCGKYVNFSRLHKSRKNKRLLCTYCYKSENKDTLKANVTPEIKPITNSMKNAKCLVRRAHVFNTEYLKQDESDFMKYKYGKDGSDRIRRLKKEMKITKMITQERSIEKNQPDNRNKNLLEGLKNLK